MIKKTCQHATFLIKVAKLIAKFPLLWNRKAYYRILTILPVMLRKKYPVLTLKYYISSRSNKKYNVQIKIYVFGFVTAAN
jgi:hypothetical protein